MQDAAAICRSEGNFKDKLGKQELPDYMLTNKLSFCVQEVQKKFEKYGDVTLARIVRNPVNGESRGFGFVDMKDDDGADEVFPAISERPMKETLASHQPDISLLPSLPYRVKEP